MAHKSINADVIEKLTALGGLAFLKELHNVFIRSSKELIKGIHKAIAANDPVALQEISHSLKSSSGNIGALQLSHICLQLEKFGQAKNIEQAKSLTLILEHEFQQVNIELVEIIKKS